MDKRLELTKRQVELVQKFDELYKQMRDEDVLFVHSIDNNDFCAINGKYVDDIIAPDDDISELEEQGYECMEVDLSELTLTDFTTFYRSGIWDETMVVTFKKEGV